MVVSILGLIIILVPLAYLTLLMVAACKKPKYVSDQMPSHRFAIAIPAHDEDTVIGETVKQLSRQNYPPELYTVHVVADHCSDRTAEVAREAGAQVHERNDGPRTGKGAALAWLFERILSDEQVDDVVVFDADSQVDPNFLQVMNTRLVGGETAVQGQHIISNPDDGWFPALTWAMFMVDNRFQNLGRTNLNFSAKNMGDAICISAKALREIGWGEGLTEDYQLRHKMLLKGINIHYEPTAKAYGEGALTWTQARAQRARWLRGTRDSSQKLARQLAQAGVKNHNFAQLDGAFQAYCPSFSTLTMFIGLFLAIQVGVDLFFGPVIPWPLIEVWVLILAYLFVYPLIGLALERAPLKAYLVMLSGPIFIVWRTGLAFRSRYGRKHVTWKRTAHGLKKG